MSPPVQHFVFEMLESILASFKVKGQIFAGKRRRRLVSNCGDESAVEFITEIGDGFGLWHPCHLFKEVFSQLSLFVGFIKEESVWLEVVDRLLGFPY